MHRDRLQGKQFTELRGRLSRGADEKHAACAGACVQDASHRRNSSKYVLIAQLLGDIDFFANLNRNPHSTMAEAQREAAKVACLAEAARRIGFDLELVPIVGSLHDPMVVREVSTCDVVFGCMDTVDGRALLNRLATFYLLPYFDVGVRLDADGAGAIYQICGMVNCFQPGRSSFFSRGIFTVADVSAAALKRTDPSEYKKRLEQKYIKGLNEDRPAVMPVNMTFAGLVVMEFFARIHPYRVDGNSDYAWTRLSLSHGIYDHGAESEDCSSVARYVGRGDTSPLLDMPDLTELPRARCLV